MPAARPTEAQIARAIRAAQKCGVEVRGIEVAPGGTVRILADAPEAGLALGAPEEDACDAMFGLARSA